MAADFTIEQGDTGPAIQVTCYAVDDPVQGVDTPVDVSGATFKFNMGKANTSTVLVDHGTATVVDGPNGKVKYQWQAGDTAVAGQMWGEFEGTFSDGTVVTFPNKKKIAILVTKQVA